MDKLHSDILKLLRKSIVEDMDVYNGVINHLKAEYVLGSDDVQKIQKGSTREERANILLNILPSRGPRAFEIFRQALRHHYEWLSDDMDKMEDSGRTFNDPTCLASPNVPPMSPLTVIRQDKITKLKEALEKLEPNGYVAIHGMKGFGKSCLAASTLKDAKLIRNLFHNEVYWIKFGYKRPIDEEIIIQLNKLYHLVKNIEVLTEPIKPETLKNTLINFLCYHFSRKDHCHALLILNDVCDRKIIKTFDFGCKTLVITADIDVLWEKRPTVILMKDGFTEAETLGLFAKVLDTDVNRLPIEAKRIHEECKGMPLLIAMFSAQFEEFKHDMRCRPDRWRYYLDCLKKKDSRNIVIRKFFEKQEAIFNMCIEQLPSDLRQRYTELSIFSEDVNIIPRTLEILWEGSPFQVEEIMLELCHKSLAAKQWNDELHTYVYGVHDLLLCHLRKNLTADQLVELHKSLVLKYLKCCNNDFSKLPEDNYSYSYIGYHLEQSKLFDKFSDIYFDFEFIQAMIIHSGLNNFLIDLDSYRKHITKNCNPVLEGRVEDLVQFLEEQASIIGEHKRKKCLDLTQIALKHSHLGYIQENALKLAREKTNYLYLSHCQRLGHICTPSSEELSTKPRRICFACDPQLFLIGNDEGEIFLWDSAYKKQKIYKGYSKKCPIKKIVVPPGGEYFLTLSETGIARLFRLFDENVDENHIPPHSPRQKQTFWSGIFANGIFQDDSLALFTVADELILDVTLGHDNTYIAGCTNKGTIRLWDCHGQTLADYHHAAHNSSCLKNITFTTEGNLLHIVDEIKGVLISYSKYEGKYTYVSQYNPNLQGKKIVCLCTIPDQSNSLIIVTEKEAVYIKWFSKIYDQLHSYKKQVRAYIESESIVYVCAALTSDGQYLVLADSGGFINVWNTDIGYKPIATYKRRVTSLDTYWMAQDRYHLISGCENELLHKWKLPIQQTHNPTRKPLFDALVQPFGEHDFVVTETFSNSIVGRVGDRVLIETEQVCGNITHLIISSDGSIIVYATDKGIVSLVYVHKMTLLSIMRLSRPIEFIKIMNIEHTDIVICRQTDNNLHVWQAKDKTYLVQNAGYVVAAEKVNENNIITLTRDGTLMLWIVHDTMWLRSDKVVIGNANTVTNVCCLSYYEHLVAVLDECGEIFLYTLQDDETIVPRRMKIIEYYRKKFTSKLTCCDITQNEQYLAIGFENGAISIIDIPTRVEIRKFCFHSTSIRQLSWAPSVVGHPILLSVNGDEMAWWNISLGTNVTQVKRKRPVLNRSVSTPSISRNGKIISQMSTSQTVDANVCTLDFEDEVSPSKYWKLKEAKYPNQPELLAVVELPSNFYAKVCISRDFMKFLTVDIYGCISTFTVFGYT